MANLDMVLVCIIVIATMAMFIWGKARIDIIALCALVALFVLGLIESEQVLYGLANTATVTITSDENVQVYANDYGDAYIEAYAYDNDMAEQAPIQIEAASTSVEPSWHAYGNAIGGVSAPGDLFYIDAADSAIDALVTLHLTNADELIYYYRYLILKVGVYVQDDTGQWEKATTGNGEPFPDTYLTMRNGRVDFCLPGYARYKLTIDGGSFYCFPIGSYSGSVSPGFYLTAEQEMR